MISESVNPNNVGIGILGGLGDWIAIALAFGLTVMVCIYLFGRISGAHLNPAVTIGLLVSKNISLADSVYYIVAQVIGACFGSLAVFLCLGMPSVETLDLSNLSSYDQGCNEEFQNAMKNYFEGKATKDEALDLFYKAVTEKYPELTY